MEKAHRDLQWEGPPLPLEFVLSFKKKIGAGGDILIATENGDVVGGGIFLYDQDTTQYFHSAIDRTSKSYPISAIMAQSIKMACESGRRRFNLGGVNEGNQGLVKFKRAWGAEPQSYLVLSYRGWWARKMKVK